MLEWRRWSIIRTGGGKGGLQDFLTSGIEFIGGVKRDTTQGHHSPVLRRPPNLAEEVIDSTRATLFR